MPTFPVEETVNVPLVTPSTDGLMTAADKTKLDGITQTPGTVNILDEGVTVRPATTFIDFRGSGVVATPDGLVTISGAGVNDLDDVPDSPTRLALTTAERTKLANVPADTNAELAGKAAVTHTHSIANVTGLQAALDAKDVNAVAQVMTANGTLTAPTVIVTGGTTFTLGNVSAVQVVINETTAALTVNPPASYSYRSGSTGTVAASSRKTFHLVAGNQVISF